MSLARRVAMLAISNAVGMTVLASVALASSTPITLHWTAPGADSVFGRAQVYDLRYSRLPITTSNFLLATKVTGLPSPAVAGTLESFVVSGLSDDVTYFMAIKAADGAGNWSKLSNLWIRQVMTVGVDPAALSLSFSPPRPNPARASARWVYSMPQPARVQVDVFDAQGRRVRTLADGERAAGQGELSWDLRDAGGSPVGAGIYFVTARLGSAAWTSRLVVIR